MKLATLCGILTGAIIASTGCNCTIWRTNNNSTSLVDTMNHDHSDLFSILIIEQLASCQIVMKDNLLFSPIGTNANRKSHWKRSFDSDSPSSSSSTTTIPITPSTDYAASQPLVTTSDSSRQSPPSSLQKQSTEKEASHSPKASLTKSKSKLATFWGTLQKSAKCVGEFCKELDLSPSDYTYINAMSGHHYAASRPMKEYIDLEKQNLEQAIRNSIIQQHRNDEYQDESPPRHHSSYAHDKGEISDQGRKKTSFNREHAVLIHRKDLPPIFHGSSSNQIYDQDAPEKKQQQQQQQQQQLKIEQVPRVQPPIKKVTFRPQQREVVPALRRRNRYEIIKGFFTKEVSPSEDHEESLAPLESIKIEHSQYAQHLDEKAHHPQSHSEKPCTPLESIKIDQPHHDKHFQETHHHSHPHSQKRGTTAPVQHLVKRAVIPEAKVEGKSGDNILQKRNKPIVHARIVHLAQSKSPAKQAQINTYLKSKYGAYSPQLHLPLRSTYERENGKALESHANLKFDEFGMPITPSRVPLSKTSLSQLRKSQSSKEVEDRWHELQGHSREKGITKDPDTDPFNVNMDRQDGKARSEMPQSTGYDIEDDLWFHRNFLASQKGKEQVNIPERTSQDHGHEQQHQQHQEGVSPPVTKSASKPSLRRTKSFSGPIHYQPPTRADLRKKYAVYSGPFDKYDKKESSDKIGRHAKIEDKGVHGSRKDDVGSSVDTLEGHRGSQ